MQQAVRASKPVHLYAPYERVFKIIQTEIYFVLHGAQCIAIDFLHWHDISTSKVYNDTLHSITEHQVNTSIILYETK